jgi:hypothetical protein
VCQQHWHISEGTEERNRNLPIARIDALNALPIKSFYERDQEGIRNLVVACVKIVNVPQALSRSNPT